MEMVGRNKYDPLHPTAALLIISDCGKNQNERNWTTLKVINSNFCKIVDFREKRKPMQIYYLLAKPKLQNCTFNPRSYFIKLFTRKSFPKTQLSQLIFLNLGLKKLQHQSGKKFFCDINQWKIFHNVSAGFGTKGLDSYQISLKCI